LGDVLWSTPEAGGWIDLAPSVGVIVASRQGGGVIAYNLDGKEIWGRSDSSIWADRDGLCVSSGGEITAVIGMPMIFAGNAVQIIDENGDVLWEEIDDLTVPWVAVSPNGRYVAVSFSRQLRLFEVRNNS